MDEAQVRSVAKEFLEDEDVAVTGIANGEYNRVYLLSAKSGKYALRAKLKPTTIDADALAYEVEFMEKLRQTQDRVQVAHNIPAKTGQLLYEDATGYFNLQTLVPGVQRYKMWYEASKLTPDGTAEVFDVLGAMHNASRQIRMQSTKKASEVLEFLSQYAILLRENALPEGKFKHTVAARSAFMRERMGELTASLRAADYDRIPLHAAHYDMNVCNVLWEGEKIVSVVDFDWTRPATLEFDFCRAASLNCSDYADTDPAESMFNPDKLRAAIRAYNAAVDVPLTNMRMMSHLLDVSSLFLSHWAFTTFAETRQREDYLLRFFMCGVERLRHTEYSDLTQI